jgi:hypothetical protein
MHEPLGHAPPTPTESELDLEIQRYTHEFEQLGLDARSTVMMWIGKPNRFDGSVLMSAFQVLHYVAAELDVTRNMKAQMHAAAVEDAPAEAAAEDAPAAPPAGHASPAQGVVTTTPQGASDDRAQRRAAHKQALAQANEAWRQAIEQRAAAVVQWDAYVGHMRSEYQKLKLIKPV